MLRKKEWQEESVSISANHFNSENLSCKFEALETQIEHPCVYGGSRSTSQASTSSFWRLLRRFGCTMMRACESGEWAYREGSLGRELPAGVLPFYSTLKKILIFPQRMSARLDNTNRKCGALCGSDEWSNPDLKLAHSLHGKTRLSVHGREWTDDSAYTVIPVVCRDSIWIALIAVPVIGPPLHCLLRPQLPK